MEHHATQEEIVDAIPDVSELPDTEVAGSTLSGEQRPRYSLPLLHRSGTDKTTGKPIYTRTLDPEEPRFKLDTKPMTVEELYTAANRAGYSFPHWQFATYIRHMLRMTGYRLGMAA